MSSSFPGQHGEQQDVRLTENERKLVAKLFSDPTYFPIEFRTWLKNYIQDAGLTVTASQIRGGGTSIRTRLPAGIFVTCGALAAVPPDALACDGSAISRSVYDLLFAAIGTTWGPGDGSTTFNLPDFRDRAPFGAGATVTVGATDSQGYGTRGGASHQHGTHNHWVGRQVVSLTAGPTPYSILGDQSDKTSSSTEQTRVGPTGTNVDGPNWAGVVFAITTGQTA